MVENRKDLVVLFNYASYNSRISIIEGLEYDQSSMQIRPLPPNNLLQTTGKGKIKKSRTSTYKYCLHFPRNSIEYSMV